MRLQGATRVSYLEERRQAALERTQVASASAGKQATDEGKPSAISEESKG